MPSIDFDFQRYVERRKGAREAQAREGAAYAYAGDLKVLRTLDRLRPVKLALEAAERLWRSTARAELLGPRASTRQHPEVLRAVERGAASLHVAAPPTYVAAQQAEAGPGPGEVRALGTEDEPFLVLDAALVKELSEAELTDAIGRALGHIQNGHVLYATALFYLERFANRFVQWIVKPALLTLRGWARRAAITGDRAGLLCTRDLEISLSALAKTGAAPERLEALRVFADSAYYRGVLGQGEGGLTPEACDERVAELLK